MKLALGKDLPRAATPEERLFIPQMTLTLVKNDAPDMSLALDGCSASTSLQRSSTSKDELPILSIRV